MTTITTKAMAKVATVATGLAMATSMLSLAPIAHADCSVGTANLTIGSSGAAVTCLQQGLIAAGHSIPAGATGYFGTQTRAAVASWQSALNIAPAVGYFGPISRAAWGSSVVTPPGPVSSCPAGTFDPATGKACGTTSTVPGCQAGDNFSRTTGQSCSGGTTVVPGGPLTGNGRLTNVTSLGNVTSNPKVGDSVTSIMGLSADATGGDVAVQRVDATFTVANVSSQSSNLNKYVSDVSLWLNGTKIANMDPALGDQSGRVWTFRFSGLNGVIKAGTTGQIYVKVTPVTSIGTNEDGKTVTASLAADAIRAVAADGISDTYGAVVSQAFTVSSATTGTLTTTAASDNPVAGNVAVSSSTTTGVKVLSLNLKAKNADVTITDLPVQLVTSDNSIGDVVANVYLMKGSTVISSKTVSTGTMSTTTFTSINQTIPKDTTVNYTVVVDLKGDSAYVDGTTLIASTTVYGWNASDANGATVNPSAAVTGNSQTLSAVGLTVAFVSSNALRNTGTLAGNADSVSDTIVFKMTAGDSDIWVDGDLAASTTPGTYSDGLTWATTTDSNTGTTTSVSASLTASDSNSSDVTTSGSVAFKINAGTSRTFTLSTTISTGIQNGQIGTRITGIKYDTTNSADILPNIYNTNLGDFKTVTIGGLNTH